MLPRRLKAFANCFRRWVSCLSLMRNRSLFQDRPRGGHAARRQDDSCALLTATPRVFARTSHKATRDSARTSDTRNRKRAPPRLARERSPNSFQAGHPEAARSWDATSSYKLMRTCAHGRANTEAARTRTPLSSSNINATATRLRKPAGHSRLRGRRAFRSSRDAAAKAAPNSRHMAAAPATSAVSSRKRDICCGRSCEENRAHATCVV